MQENILSTKSFIFNYAFIFHLKLPFLSNLKVHGKRSVMCCCEWSIEFFELTSRWINLTSYGQFNNSLSRIQPLIQQELLQQSLLLRCFSFFADTAKIRVSDQHRSRTFQHPRPISYALRGQRAVPISPVALKLYQSSTHAIFWTVITSAQTASLVSPQLSRYRQRLFFAFIIVILLKFEVDRRIIIVLQRH